VLRWVLKALGTLSCSVAGDGLAGLVVVGTEVVGTAVDTEVEAGTEVAGIVVAGTEVVAEESRVVGTEVGMAADTEVAVLDIAVDTDTELEAGIAGSCTDCNCIVEVLAEEALVEGLAGQAFAEVEHNSSQVEVVLQQEQENAQQHCLPGWKGTLQAWVVQEGPNVLEASSLRL